MSHDGQEGRVRKIQHCCFLTHMRHLGTIVHMTAERQERIPELTLGWRLKMSLGDITRDEIAEIMDVTPSTISRWMSDKGAPPKRPYLLQWAMATGVPVEWLEYGHTSQSSPDPGQPSDALSRLTEQKQSRSRRPSTTREYLRRFQPEPAAA